VRARECIICGSGPPFTALYRRDGHSLVRCECGLVFQEPQPAPEVLRTAYYHDEDFAASLLGRLREQTLANARAKLGLLRAGGHDVAGWRVLDVGASSGAWVEVASEAGAASAVGVEIGEATSASARERGLDVRTGTLEQLAADLAGTGFDLISFWDVLEHLHDPRRELALARDLLGPGGRIAATFPNVDGLYPQLTYRLFARRTGVWEYPELPVHLYDFAPGTARELFRGAGYEVEVVRTFAIPYGFYRTTTLAPARIGTGFRARLLRAAFSAVRLGAYPLARVSDRGNAMFVVAAAA